MPQSTISVPRFSFPQGVFKIFFSLDLIAFLQSSSTCFLFLAFFVSPPVTKVVHKIWNESDTFQVSYGGWLCLEINLLISILLNFFILLNSLQKYPKISNKTFIQSTWPLSSPTWKTYRSTTTPQPQKKLPHLSKVAESLKSLPNPNRVFRLERIERDYPTLIFPIGNGEFISSYSYPHTHMLTSNLLYTFIPITPTSSLIHNPHNLKIFINRILHTYIYIYRNHF